jgi:hypothetical protein
MRVLPLAVLAGFVFAPPLASQQPAAAHAAAQADVASMGGIVGALYASISGPAGPRDWDRFRSLFAQGARLIPSRRNQDSSWTPNVLTVEDYIRRVTPYFDQNPFYERQAARTVERFGHIAHVFSTYESRNAPDAQPFVRGINSIQLFFDGSRWWIVSVLWDDERGGGPIPRDYLPS